MTNPTQKHLVIEISGAAFALLDDLPFWQELLPQLASKAGSTIVGQLFHKFTPQGLSGVLLLAESHLTIHTWPEYGTAALDFFTCGSQVEPTLALELLQQQVAPAAVSWQKIA